MSKHLYWLLVFLAAAPAMARDIPENWLEVRSPHFTVVTDASEKQGRSIAAQFERMRAILQDFYPQFGSDDEDSLVVLAVKAQKEFRSLEPTAYLSENALELHGLFVRSSEKNYILMRLDAEVRNPYALVYHEYTHLMLSEVFDVIPLWLDEGLAEFYQSTEIIDRQVLLGEPNQQHLMRLRSEKLIPLPTLFTIDAKSPYYIDEKKASVFYAECWALTHFLTLQDYQNKTSRVQEYTELVSDGVDPATAGTRVFGDLKKLEKTLVAYIEQRTLDHFQINTAARVDASKFLVQPLTATQAEIVEADFLAGDGRVEEARNRLQHGLQLDPENASAHQALAQLQVSKAQDHAVEGAPNSNSITAISPAETEKVDPSLHLPPKQDPPQNDGPKTASDSGLDPVQPTRNRENDHPIVQVLNGPHRVLVGVLEDVHCEPPNLDLTVRSGTKMLRLHAENYYKIEFTALFKPSGDLEPCRELENRPAKVQYVESPDGSGLAYLIAVELHK